MSRWLLLVLLGCGGSGSSTAPQAVVSPENAATTLYVGGPVLTMSESSPRAEAVAVTDGVITAVGSRQALEAAHKGAATKVVDLQGQALLPGFFDAHGHLSQVGLQSASANLLPPPDGEVGDEDSLVQTLKDYVASKPMLLEKTGWVVGFGYDDSQLASHQHPTRAVLDTISTEVPIMIIHQSGHLGVMNSKGLEIAKITAETLDPPGGHIRKGPDGQPTGVLEENAWFMSNLPFASKVDDELGMALVDLGIESYASFGYTTAQEGRAMDATVSTLVARAKQGQMPIDVVLYADYTATKRIAPPYSEGYQNGFRIGGIKLSIDGSPQGKTAWLTKPYFKPPEGKGADYVGYPAMSEEQVDTWVSTAYEKGWQVLVHANGDAAIDQLLSSVDKATKTHGLKDRRPVLIHGQTLRPDQIEPLKRLQIFPSLFPMHTFYWGDWHRESVLGEERAAYISPTRAVRDAGMRFSTHHDAPVVLPDSIRVLSATVNRTTRTGFVLGPDQRVSVEEALLAMTLWPAYQHFEEDKKGSIEAGKDADFVVLSADPTAMETSQLADLSVIATYKRDVEIYRADKN